MCSSKKPRIPPPQPEKKPQFLRNRYLDPSSGVNLNTIGLGALRLRPRGSAPGSLPGPGGLPTPYPYVPPGTLSPFAAYRGVQIGTF